MVRSEVRSQMSEVGGQRVSELRKTHFDNAKPFQTLKTASDLRHLTSDFNHFPLPLHPL